MLKNDSLKRHIKTNKIWKVRLTAKVKDKTILEMKNMGPK